ncbi:MAG TPA: PDR/VanB family oxidoreductase [Mycobacteriales bacterium]|nr:PDR/VanB family oxidoreductase [Mycobacteriales bacterium]
MSDLLSAVPRAPAGKRADDRLQLVVEAVEQQAPGICSVTLADPHGRPLPSFVPGSHVVVDCGPRRNAYSLTGPCLSPRTYTVSVLHKADGNGGSVWMHALAHGAAVAVAPPRSMFAPVAGASHHLLVAGGIGVTPIVSHARSAAGWGQSFQVLYGHRPGSAAYADVLRELCGDRLETWDDQAGFLRRIGQALLEQPLGTHLYVCGPAPLMDVVGAAAAAAGWPADRVHTERFSGEALEPGEAFTARLARSGLTVAVPAGVSLLDALEGAGVEVPNMCREGVCGECRVPVLAGRPLHRDLFLSPDERAAGDAVMCCVSRGVDAVLELDL